MIPNSKRVMKIQAVIVMISLVFSINTYAQLDTCKVPWIPPTYSVSETHWDVPSSFWQNGGHIPENTVNEDTTDYARAHIKATGSATLRISDDTEGAIYAEGQFVGYVVKCRAFRDTIFDGVTITTYLDGTFQESYTGDQLWVEYIPQYVNDPICLGFWTTLPWNEIEITFDTLGGRVHYDVFYAVIQGPCNEELPPGLPLTWLSFEVQKKGEASNLKWITAQEFNNAGFQVERSSDGRLFEKIGTVDATSVPRDINEYSFVDEAPLGGLNYYRIMQIDVDGKTHYSNVQTLNFGVEGEVTFWPNPAAGNLFITMPEELRAGGEIRLVNYAGVVVLSKTYEKADQESSLDISLLEPGLYSLIIESPYSRHINKLVIVK